jgi:hypothetical protein
MGTGANELSPSLMGTSAGELGPALNGTSAGVLGPAWICTSEVDNILSFVSIDFLRGGDETNEQDKIMHRQSVYHVIKLQNEND